MVSISKALNHTNAGCSGETYQLFTFLHILYLTQIKGFEIASRFSIILKTLLNF